MSSYRVNIELAQNYILQFDQSLISHFLIFIGFHCIPNIHSNTTYILADWWYIRHSKYMYTDSPNIDKSLG